VTRAALQRAAALVSGLLFGAGLVIGGMTRPQKVIGFLDLFGAWDPSLMLVMAGAVGVHAGFYAAVRRRRAPLFADTFAIPTRRDIDLKLLLGALLFGIGWGLSGYCPGPSVVALGTGALKVLVFVGALLAGMLAAAKLELRLARR
jgi:uncharacterized membrane protein YedE/YeeE